MRINDPLQSVNWPADPQLDSNLGPETPSGFAQAMDQVRQDMNTGMPAQTRTLNPNENLTWVVRQEASARGLKLDATQQKLAILALARDNQLDHPDRVMAGQKLRLNGLIQQLDGLKNQTQPATRMEEADTTQASVTFTPQSHPSETPSIASERMRIVKSRDTLTQIVAQEARSRGLSLTQAQVYKEVMDLAQSNRLSNPNQIWPGQQLNLAELQQRLDNLPNTSNVDVAATVQATKGTQTYSAASASLSKATPTSPYPVLSQTLDRAVARGFIPANERQDVYNKILQVAQKHQFSPDDFARLTLMESDGMNPRASNQRCHGIIQFCDGPSQGAAGVGYAQAPKSILNLSVYQQLHLVDVYFDKVGLKKQGPVKLDDLYLAVLHPAARTETRPEAPLVIAGTQAQALYEGRNTQAPITRNSIIQGLWKNAMDRLGLADKSTPAKVGGRPTSTSSMTTDDGLYSSASEKL